MVAIVIGLTVPAAAPLDDVLVGAASSSSRGELLQRAGLIDSMAGIALAIGLLVFLAVVHRGPSSEVTLLTRVVNVLGAVVVAGAAIEIAGAASIEGVGWSAAFGDPWNGAAMMRFLAGLLLLLGVVDQRARSNGATPGTPLDARPVDVAGAGVAAGTACADLRTAPPPPTLLGDDTAPSDELRRDDLDEADEVSWVPGASSAFGLGGAVAGLLSFVFDGNTVTRGPRVLHALVDVVHVGAASVWFGGIAGLAIVSWARRHGGSSALLTARFTTIAGYALVAVALSGSLMSLMITDGWDDFTGTAWGGRLLVKLGAVGLALGLGAFHLFVVMPALELDGYAAATLRRARATLTVQALVLLVVVIVTVFLTFASPG